MYNHYIPQSAGSYRRRSQNAPRRPPPPPQSSILDFFKGLLPRGLDTADLMIVFLLLLMNKDDEGGISPVLTLALYFLL